MSPTGTAFLVEETHTLVLIHIQTNLTRQSRQSYSASADVLRMHDTHTGSVQGAVLGTFSQRRPSSVSSRELLVDMRLARSAVFMATKMQSMKTLKENVIECCKTLGLPLADICSSENHESAGGCISSVTSQTN